jgi:hypothetical protein
VQLTAKTIDSTIQFAAENADNIKKLERNLLESNRRSNAKWFWTKAETHRGDLKETGTKLHEDRASIFSSPTFAQNYGVHRLTHGMGGVYGAAAGRGLGAGLRELGKHIPAEGGLLVWRQRA